MARLHTKTKPDAGMGELFPSTINVGYKLDVHDNTVTASNDLFLTYWAAGIKERLSSPLIFVSFVSIFFNEKSG